MDDRILDTFGGRLFVCRSQIGKSKLYFHKKYNIDRQILSRYEQSKFKPCRKDKVVKIFNALVAEGIQNLTLNWLLTGSGDKPLIDITYKTEENTKEKDPINAAKDITFFEKRYSNSIKHLVNDDSLSPFINLGDWVCGVVQTIDSISYMKNQLAIIIEKKLPIKKVGLVDLLYDGNFKLKNNNKRFEKIQKADLLCIAPVIIVRKSKDFRTISNFDHKKK